MSDEEREVQGQEEIDFGDYALIDPFEYHFEKSPDKYWVIVPVTSGHEVARSKFLLHNRVAETIDGVRYEQPPTALEIAHREIALLFGGTNLTRKNGQPVLREKPSVFEVEAIVAKMPPEMVKELWIKVGELFPKWGPADPKALEGMM
jgi:hypothetical protein